MLGKYKTSKSIQRNIINKWHNALVKNLNQCSNKIFHYFQVEIYVKNQLDKLFLKKMGARKLQVLNAPELRRNLVGLSLFSMVGNV